MAGFICRRSGFSGFDPGAFPENRPGWSFLMPIWLLMRVAYFYQNFTLSHSKERKEKVCLNCKAALYGRYCHVCGQENIEPKQPAWHLVTHFFSDITHFDGKFFTTLKDLVIKPGFLSREYMAGRRASYLNPVRMYVFTSAFFFVIFFTIVNPKKFRFNEGVKSIRDSTLKTEKGLEAELADAGNREDSEKIQDAMARLKRIPVMITPDSSDRKDSGIRATLYSEKGFDYKTVEEYDSVQMKLKPDLRDGWFKRIVSHRAINLVNKYHEDAGGFFKEMITNFLHTLPQVLFISLPIFALLLKLLYVRHKKYYYVDHGIFAIHLYIYSFIALLIVFLLEDLKTVQGLEWVSILEAILFIFSLYYYYKAMRKFYLQGRGKTVFKYLLLLFLSVVMMVFLFIFSAGFSAMEI